MTEIHDRLAGSAIFGGLRAGQLETIAGCADAAAFARGAHLVTAGEPAHTFHLITSGAVAVEIDIPGRGPVMIADLATGDLVGASWLFPPYRWQFEGIAIEPTETVAFDADRLRAAAEADHELGYRLYQRFARIMSDRLQATRLQLLDLYSVDRR